MSLMAIHPTIANEWHPNLNVVSPSDVAPYSHKRVWWRCSEGHEWQTAINNRTCNGTTCPYCSGRLPTKETSFGSLFPNLIEEWHPTKNTVTPFEVTKFSHKSIWWRCLDGHEWKSGIANRTNRGSGCPYCKGNLHTPETCLAAVYPEIAAEWHPTKNDKTPSDVTKSGKYKAWWKCSICKHEWQTSINNRTDKNSGCPKCKVGLSTSIQELRLWSEMVFVFGQDNVKHRYNDLGFELDVFIPTLQVGIEYDGRIWHEACIAKDTKKYEKAKAHNIYLIRVSELPVPADRVFVAKKVTHHLVKDIVSCLNGLDVDKQFETSISSYLNTQKFQNSNLFKTTYTAVRTR